VRRGLGKLDGLSDSSMRRSFAHPAVMHALFSILASGTALARISCYHVCAHIFPLLDIALVQGFAARTGLHPPGESLVAHLLQRVGHSSNVWGRQFSYTQGGQGGAHTRGGVHREAAEVEYGVGVAQLSLLRALASSSAGAAGAVGADAATWGGLVAAHL
ncbi:hypothetical protein B484DRAFT_408682, partial [Ochromonadaceae sp. CCMP2298]